MTCDLLFEIYESKFKFWNLINSNVKDQIIYYSVIYQNDRLNDKDYKDKNKFDLFLINRMYVHNIFYIKQLQGKFENNEDEPVKKFIHEFLTINRMFNLNEEKAYELLNRIYVIDNKNILLESFFKHYIELDSLVLKIPISEVIDISLSHMTHIFKKVEEYVTEKYMQCEETNSGYITLSIFERFLLKFYEEIEVKSKLREYFK